MGDLNSFLNLFDKITIQRIGTYLSMVTDLYLKPIESWKKILSETNSSINNFIFYVLFYSTFIYINTWNLQQVVTHVLVTLLVNIIPFIFLVIPFLVYRKIWKIQIKANRIYRLFFVFNVQMIPFIHFPDIIAQWAGVEFPFIISSASKVIFDLLIILTIPLIINLNFKQKFIWIISNYIFSCIYLLIFNVILLNSNDVKLILNKATLYTPEEEYRFMMKSYKKSDLYLDNIIYVSQHEKNGKIETQVQYSTLFTTNYLTKSINNSFKSITDFETLNINKFSSEHPFEIYNEIYRHYKKDSTLLKYSFKPLSKKDIIKLNSLKVHFNNIFYSDLKLMDSLKSKAKYKSNREYAKYVYNYLNQFNLITNNKSNIINLIKSKKFISVLEFEDSYYLFFYVIDKNTFKYKLEEIINRNLIFNDKYENPYYISYFLFYPTFKILSFIFPDLDYRDQFEYISFLKKKN